MLGTVPYFSESGKPFVMGQSAQGRLTHSGYRKIIIESVRGLTDSSQYRKQSNSHNAAHQQNRVGGSITARMHLGGCIVPNGHRAPYYAF